MKTRIILLLFVIFIAMPLSAKTNLLNLGFGTQGDYLNNEVGIKMKNAGLTYVFQGGDTSGFYFLANPYFGTKLKNLYGDTLKLSEIPAASIGSSFIFGYGGDINWGKVGLILGGGLFLDANIYSETYSDQYTFSSGLGGGINFYIQPGDGKFVINAGLSAAWRPLTLDLLYDYTNQQSLGFFASQTYFNLNIGIGWRVGGVRIKPKEEPEEEPEEVVPPEMLFTRITGASKGLEFHVGTTRESVFENLGKPSRIFYGGDQSWPSDTLDADGYHIYNNLGLSFLIFGDVVQEITILNNGWKGPGGIKVGSSLKSAIEVLGDDDSYQDFSGKDFYGFSDLGIVLEVNDSNQQIMEINIKEGISVFM